MDGVIGGSEPICLRDFYLALVHRYKVINKKTYVE
jgi:hypothetical protein